MFYCTSEYIQSFKVTNLRKIFTRMTLIEYQFTIEKYIFIITLQSHLYIYILLYGCYKRLEIYLNKC